MHVKSASRCIFLHLVLALCLVKSSDQDKNNNMVVDPNLLIQLLSQLEKLNEVLEESDAKISKLQEDIDVLKDELEEVTKLPRVSESCDEIAALGTAAKSGWYWIDFDGKYGSPPTRVYCEFPSLWTSMGNVSFAQIDPCLERQCQTINMTYENLPQIKAMLDQSEYCLQQIIFDCIGAPIEVS